MWVLEVPMFVGFCWNNHNEPWVQPHPTNGFMVSLLSPLLYNSLILVLNFVMLVNCVWVSWIEKFIVSRELTKYRCMISRVTLGWWLRSLKEFKPSCISLTIFICCSLLCWPTWFALGSFWGSMISLSLYIPTIQ